MLQRGGATRSIQQRDSCSVAAAVVTATRCRTRQHSEDQQGQCARRLGRRPPQLARKKSSHSTARSTQPRMRQHCCLEGTSASGAESRCCNVAAQNPSSSRRSKHPAEQNPCGRGSKSSEICADEVNFCLQSLKDFSTVRTYFQEDRRRRSGCEKNLVQPFLFQSLRSMELKDSTERLDVKIFNP